MTMASRILIVEDNETNRILIRDILRYHGYEVEEAENGMEALRKASDRPPDLILLDIQMPVMDGFTALRHLREMPGLKGTCIIALTSFAMTGDREMIMRAGFDDYISKPIDTRSLPGLIRRHLEGEAMTGLKKGLR